ncbi:hypothetical protein C5167_028193 [Papaver somniferum]|nr:hypothetical protein C5167_028193 [Papaver somniferum]
MLRNEFDLEFILESVKKTIMGFFFGCFRVKDENQNHHIISVSSNKKNPLASRNRLAVLHLSESQGVNYVLDEDDYELLWDNNVGFHRPAPVILLYLSNGFVYAISFSVLGDPICSLTFFIYLNKVSAGCGAYITCKQEMMQPNASIKDRFIWTQFPSNLMNALLLGDAIQDLHEPRRHLLQLRGMLFQQGPCLLSATNQGSN